MHDIQDCINRVAIQSRPLATQGQLAGYIPALMRVDPSKFGFAVATLDGNVYTAGDADEPFSIQSISKLFALVLASSREGDSLWMRVGRLPSSNQFNSLLELELESGKPRNPFLILVR